MKKWLLCSFITLITTLGFALTSTVNGITWTYQVSSGKASITDCPYSISGSITIPSTLGGYPVTSIGSQAFQNCSGLTSVRIPSSVTSIGDRAFYLCSSLTSVTIPSSVTSIGQGAFSICSSLISVTIPEGVTSIGERAFYNCFSLTSVTIPSSVTSIGDWAFEGCSNLPKDENGVQYESAAKVVLIDVPTSMTGEFVIPNTVRFIHSDAFYNCSGLTSVTIPSSVTSIGTSAFLGCSKLPKDENGVQYESEAKVVLIDVPTSMTGEFVIPNTVRFIHSQAFRDCSGLTSVTIPSSVTAIGGSAFYNCSSLTSVTIPSSVTSIGGFTFFFCRGLTSVTIPEGVTTIGEFAFRSCSGLTSVTIPSSVTSIGDDAFYDCSGLTSVTISEGVTTIGNSAFDDCTGLTSVTIPSSVTSIGEGAFSGCSSLTSFVVVSANQHYSVINGLLCSKDGKTLVACPGGLTSVTIPSSVTTIGDSAFERCTGLTSVTIPSSVTTIGYYAFYNCSSLTSVTISEGVTTIGYSAFSGCSGLTSVTIPEGVTWIGDYAFHDCFSLTSVTIPKGATSIGDSAFSGVAPTTLTAAWLPGGMSSNNLTTLIIPEGVTTIGDSAFRGCSSLTSVTIPSSVTSIGNSAFSGVAPTTLTAAWLPSGMSNSNLTTLIIPEGVTSIGVSAFYNCSSLTSVTIPEGVTTIGDSAFRGCSGLTSVTIPSSVTSIGDYYAFKDCLSLTSFVVNSANQHYSAINDLLCSKDGKTLVACPGGLTSVTIPSSVTSIGNSAFSGCSRLTSVTIPSSVTSIRDSAFSDCSRLTSVTIPSSVTSIGAYAFYNCSSLTSVTIPSSVTSIGSWAFSGCSRLTSVTIPYSVTSIGNDAFHSCLSLTSFVVDSANQHYSAINDLLCSKDGKTLVACPGGLTSVTIPSSVTTIGYRAFSGCSRLTSVTIPSSVTSIGDWAFCWCTGLTSVTIPEGVTTIGSCAFYDCSSLTSVDFKGEPPKVVSDVFYNLPSSATGTYLPQYAEAWKAVIDANSKWNGLTMESNFFTYEIKDNAVTITGLQGTYPSAISIPATLGGYPVTSIGASAFEGCTSLTSVTIPEGVTSIGDGAFYGCSKLWKDENGVQYESEAKVVLINVPTSMTGEFVIPSTVRFIHTSAFSGCSGLTSVIIPSNVTSIGSSAFEGCLSLTMVKFEGCPPKNIGLEVFPDTKGVYALSHATAWLDVMDEGKWNNLEMALLAEAYAPCETYTLNTMGDVTLVSPVVMPVAAVDSFTVTICYTSGTLRTEIRKVELLDVATGRVIAVDVHAGYSGHAAEANVYTFSGIDPKYAGKKLLVQSTIGIDQAGTSSGQILLSNGVTHYSPPYSFGINFTDADGQDIVTSTGAGFAMNEYAMPKNWTNLRGSTIGYAEITVANRPCSVSWAAHGVWNSGCATDTDNQKLLRGYLDDVAYSARTKAAVTITGLPANRKYAVALILSGDGSGDDFNGRYSPVLINGEVYSYRGTTLLTGDEARAATTWGDRKASTSATGELTIGKNVMFVEGLSGSVLSITSALDSQRVSRLTIAGIQVWITEEPDGITSAPVDVQTVSLNFHSAESNGTVGADTTAGLVPSKGWMDLTNANGSVNQVTIWDGTSAITYPMMLDFKSKNTWGFAGVDPGYNYLRGYLDDGAHDGVNGATIMLSEVPFTQYSVIVYLATDSGEHRFHPVQVNGKWYAGSEDRTAIGYATECYDGAKARWGTSRCTMAIYGTNALRLDGLTTSSLAIQAGERSDYARGGIAAIQIVNTGAPLLDCQEIDWTAKGQLVKVSELPELTDTCVRLKLADGATLDYDTVIAEGKKIILEGEGITVNISNIDVSRADVEANISGATTIQTAYTETNGITVDGITYSYFFRGVTDANWETVSNWSSKVRSLGEEIRYVDLGGSYAPGVPDCPALWDYTLLDGEMMATIPTGDDGYKTVQVALLEGWNPRFTVRNGVHLKIATLKKLQIGNQTTDFSEWRIDDASKVTINAMGTSKWEGTPRFYIDSQEGLFVNIDVGQADYYLDDDGSLQTNARIYGVQTVKAVKIDLGDSSQLGKTRISRKLIGFATNDNATFNYEMSGVTSTSSDVTPNYANVLENVGDYTFALKEDGYYIEFIAYDVAPDSILLPEELPEATGEWLTDVLEAFGITSGSAVLAEGSTVEALEAARLLGITPSVSVSGTIATVAAESTFEVSEVVVADNAVSLSVTIAVGAGELPETLTLGGAVKLMVSDTLDGEWTEVTPAPSQIKLTRVSENKATLSVTQASGSYKFFQVLVK